MGVVKGYFRNEFQWKMFKLDHENASDFYLSPWQKNRSVLPLLVTRLFLFLGSIGILLSSLVYSWINGTLGYWAIYMTNWGVLSLPIVSGLAFAVSLRAYYSGHLDTIKKLPWYVKLYWVSYNVATPIAFLITVFYWTLLWNLEQSGVEELEYAPNRALNIFVHGINSVVMFLLLMTSRQPLRFLHGYMPVLLALTYSLFAAIYYLAGGVDNFGNPYIYPMIDWSDPGPTGIVMLLTLILFFIIHVVVVGMVAMRDALARSCIRNHETLTIQQNIV